MKLEKAARVQHVCVACTKTLETSINVVCCVGSVEIKIEV